MGCQFDIQVFNTNRISCCCFILPKFETKYSKLVGSEFPFPVLIKRKIQSCKHNVPLSQQWISISEKHESNIPPFLKNRKCKFHRKKEKKRKIEEDWILLIPNPLPPSLVPAPSPSLLLSFSLFSDRRSRILLLQIRSTAVQIWSPFHTWPPWQPTSAMDCSSPSANSVSSSGRSLIGGVVAIFRYYFVLPHVWLSKWARILMFIDWMLGICSDLLRTWRFLYPQVVSSHSGNFSWFQTFSCILLIFFFICMCEYYAIERRKWNWNLVSC